jgi:hypothetical protein
MTCYNQGPVITHALQLVRIWKEAVAVQARYNTGACLRGLRKNTRNPQSGSPVPRYTVPAEYKHRASSLRLPTLFCKSVRVSNLVRYSKTRMRNGGVWEQDSDVSTLSCNARSKRGRGEHARGSFVTYLIFPKYNLLCLKQL